MAGKPSVKPSDQISCPQCGYTNPAWYAACEKCGARLSLATADISLPPQYTRRRSRDAQAIHLPLMAHILCGWPLILVLFGGAIGGGLGGLAYGANLGIYKSGLPGIFKGILIILTGILAFIAWYMIVSAILK